MALVGSGRQSMAGLDLPRNWFSTQSTTSPSSDGFTRHCSPSCGRSVAYGPNSTLFDLSV